MSKNLGADDAIFGAYYGRGHNIDQVLRLSPRIQWSSGKSRLAVELEYTRAGYGKPNNINKGKVEHVNTISNIRLLLAAFYFF